MDRDTEQFEEYRLLLLGLAYRMLGSMWDAEDVVQEAYLRWARTERATIREPRAFLVTVVSRLALDQLRSARATREAYTGPWLPEPVPTGALGPLDTVELRDTVAYATVHLLERLSPPERAVFVLREAFAVPYDEIAAIVGASLAACRQHYHRAQLHLTEGRVRFHPSHADHAALLTRFLDAATNGDIAALTTLLSDDVVAWNDGGGKVRAALRPVSGRRNVLAFMAGLVSRYGIDAARVVEANGEPALWLSVAGQEQFVALDVRAGLIHGIFAVLNPDKLARLLATDGG
jgi:RNA polymerase sigma-70 factor (ECF subfamily)